LAALVGVVLLAMFFVIAGCGDDPILGPDDGTDDGGGSYGVIQQLAPEDSVEAAPNPEQF